MAFRPDFANRLVGEVDPERFIGLTLLEPLLSSFFIYQRALILFDAVLHPNWNYDIL